MYKSKEVTLGSFEVFSNEIYISDPCYEYDENDNSCVLMLKDFVNGQYIATMKVARIYHDIGINEIGEIVSASIIFIEEEE